MFTCHTPAFISPELDENSGTTSKSMLTLHTSAAISLEVDNKSRYRLEQVMKASCISTRQVPPCSEGLTEAF